MTSRDIIQTEKCSIYGLLYDGEQWGEIIEAMFAHDDTQQYARMMLDDLALAVKTSLVPFVSGAQATCATCRNFKLCRMHLTAPVCRHWKGVERHGKR